MKTILSIYEKSSSDRKTPNVYSKQEVVTKQKSPLADQAKSVGLARSMDLTKYESNYDLDQIDKYLD